MSLADDVERHLMPDDTTLLWRAAVGRGVLLHNETLGRLDVLAPVQERLARLGLTAEVDRSTLVVCRSSLVLVLGEERTLWIPVPSAHTHGGHGYRRLPLSEDGWRWWSHVNNARNALQIAQETDTELEAVLDWVTAMGALDVQVVQLRSEPPRPGDPGLQRLVAPPRPDHQRSADQHGAHGETTLTDYHLHKITDGSTHFDDRETTVAHALARPHPGLFQIPFGQRLRQALEQEVEVHGRIVEIGCGTGELAASFGADELDYLRVDLSPALLAEQATRVKGPALLADGTRLPLADGSVQGVICNEVIADLSAVPWDGTTEVPELTSRLERYDLPRVAGLYNLGAWRLVEEVARVLKPDGWAYLSEFGDPDAPPEEATQLDHPEVSIHFGQLVRVAEAQGLDAELVRMDDFLRADLSARQLWRPSWMALRALARSRDVHLKARAWTPEQLEDVLPFHVDGLHWVPLSEEGPGPLITRFWVVLLTPR